MNEKHTKQLEKIIKDMFAHYYKLKRQNEKLVDMVKALAPYASGTRLIDSADELIEEIENENR